MSLLYFALIYAFSFGPESTIFFICMKYYSTISSYDFSSLYTTLQHDLIKNQLVGFFIWPAMKNGLFFASEEHKKCSLWTCQKVTEVGQYLLLFI